MRSLLKVAGPDRVRALAWGVALAALFGLLYLASRYSYNLFHSVAELFSIGVAFSIFAIGWNSRRFARNEPLLFLGIALLFDGERGGTPATLAPNRRLDNRYGYPPDVFPPAAAPRDWNVSAVVSASSTSAPRADPG
mgnify:CR=1 FL=1